MKLIADISNKSISFDLDVDESGNLYFGFTDGQSSETFFTDLSFGFSVLNDGSTLIQHEKPDTGVQYEYSDQEFLESFDLGFLQPEVPYTVNVWVSNAGEYWSDQFSLTIPRPPSPYPSWSWDDEIKGWKAPVPYQNDMNIYSWDELNKEWKVGF